MNNPDVTLAAATRDDLPRLFEWMRELRRVDPMETGQVVPAGAVDAAMERLIGDASAGRVWITRAGEHQVGYVVLVFGFSVEFGGRTAFIDELFIETESRGRGIGRRVVELIICEAKRLDVRNLLLEVTESNQPARRLYESSGFRDRKYRLMSKWLGEELS